LKDKLETKVGKLPNNC